MLKFQFSSVSTITSNVLKESPYLDTIQESEEVASDAQSITTDSSFTLTRMLSCIKTKNCSKNSKKIKHPIIFSMFFLIYILRIFFFCQHSFFTKKSKHVFMANIYKTRTDESSEILVWQILNCYLIRLTILARKTVSA